MISAFWSLFMLHFEYVILFLLYVLTRNTYLYDFLINRWPSQISNFSFGFLVSIHFGWALLIDLWIGISLFLVCNEMKDYNFTWDKKEKKKREIFQNLKCIQFLVSWKHDGFFLVFFLIDWSFCVEQIAGRALLESLKMAVSMKTMSLIVASLGVLSFVIGVVAENKKVKFFVKTESC